MLDEMIPVVENYTGDNPKILVVEDDQGTAELLDDYLKISMNAQLQIATTAKEAIEMDREDPSELIIVDYMLPDMDGLELIPALNSSLKRPMILITGHPTLGRAIEALRLGATDMFVKPFDLEKMSQTIFTALTKYRQDQIRLKRLMRVRDLSKKVIHDRRALRRKMELLCRDVVTSYRELADKVSQIPQNN